MATPPQSVNLAAHLFPMMIETVINMENPSQMRFRTKRYPTGMGSGKLGSLNHAMIPRNCTIPKVNTISAGIVTDHGLLLDINDDFPHLLPLCQAVLCPGGLLQGICFVDHGFELPAEDELHHG